MSEPYEEDLLGRVGAPVFFEGEVAQDLPLEGYPGWWVSVGFEVVDGRAEPVALRIFRRDGAVGSVTTDMLRAVHLPAIRRRLTAFFDGQQGRWGPSGTQEERDARAASFAKAFRKDRRPGRRGRGDLFFAEMAGSYVDACRIEEHPVKHLSTTYHLSASQIRSILNTARNKGLLTPSPPGQAGGQLTDKAKEILDGQH